MSLRNDQSVFKRSCISISNVLTVSAYNKLTTKPIVKKFFWKNKCHFFPKKSFVYQFSIPTYLKESRFFLSIPIFHLSLDLWSKEELSIQLKHFFLDFRRSMFLNISRQFANGYIHKIECSWSVNINKTGSILAVYCVQLSPAVTCHFWIWLSRIGTARRNV